ncbi:cofilin family protein, partial [Streptomyces sp. F8]|uniref:cofilin family protein n=1 Tax=Streptomyces sp. F8 TaxID=1436085 RepID=UPI0029D0DBFC
HLREQREVNTVVLRHEHPADVLVPELEGNLTHDELVQGLPSDEPRLVVHELSFASPEGTRRNELLLILWMPPAAEAAQEEAYTAGYTALKEYLADVHVHLTARAADQLAYRRLVALAG